MIDRTDPQAHLTQPSDPVWEAFRYVAAEMSAAECDAFEERLAAEQELREAVAQAVLIVQAVQLAEGQPSRPARELPQARSAPAGSVRRGVLHRVWVTAALALSAVLAVGLGLWHASRNDDSATVGPIVERSEDADQRDGTNLRFHTTGRLIELWGHSGSNVHYLLEAFAAEAADTGETDGTLALLGTEGSDDFDLEGEPEFRVPGWMLAAVSLPHEGPDWSAESPWEDN